MSEKRIIIRSLKTLVQNAIELKGPTKVVRQPYTDIAPVEAIFDPSEDIEEAVNCYREVDNVIAFIYGESMYAIPACGRARQILTDSGFKKDFYLHVPFIWGVYPKMEYEKWKSLREWQKKQKEKDAKNPVKAVIIHMRNLV